MSDISVKNGNQVAPASPAVTEKELMDYLDMFGGTKALLPAEKLQFLNVAKAYGLNPFKHEIYAVAYGSGDNRKCAIITGYEVYLKRAERTGLLNGWETAFSGAGESLSCRITIWRRDWDRPFTHEVYYSESVQNKGEYPNAMWSKMPRTMLRKVAIGQGFRLCFSDDLGGMPIDESEIGGERDVTEPPSPPSPPSAPAAEERSKLLLEIKSLLETQSPDDLPYFDEYEVRRWRDRVRDIPKNSIGALREVHYEVYARLAQLKAEYKPVPFDADDDGASEGEHIARQAEADEGDALAGQERLLK
jgi:phage recombination protein Bet